MLKELESLDARDGVLGAMETMYQRSKIQEESMFYEHKKHSGELPIVGVNTFLPKDTEALVPEVKLIRSTEVEKQMQIDVVNEVKARYAKEGETALAALKQTALDDGNLFEALMDASKYSTLGSISDALYEVGGAYRRSM